MPRIATRLTDKAVMNAKHDDKPKLFDGGGLFLLVKPDGRKYWRLKFRYGGKESCWLWGYIPSCLWPLPVSKQAKRASC